MSKDYISYRQLLQSLLPKGRFWNRGVDSTLTKLLNGFADSLARIESRAENLVHEAFSDTVTELLEEWETEYGLPEEGFEIESTTAGRRSTIKAKKLELGEQYPDYFIDIAQALGYTVSITEFPKSLAGIVTAGGLPITNERGVFYWMVNVHVTNRDNANIARLVYMFQEDQPAHTMALFRFYGVEFSNAFDNSFNAVPWWDGSWWPPSFSAEFSNAFANNSGYDGYRLTGAFNNAFSEDFDSYRGGDFDFNAFSNDFSKPS